MIQWTSALETGHAVVDNDHKQLIAQLNALQDALHRGEGKERVVEMIEFLAAYVQQHFDREEAHMKRVDCPAYHENCRAHDEFIAKFDDWVSRLRSAGSSTALVLDVHRETSAWIRSHIIGVDCKLRGCRQA